MDDAVRRDQIIGFLGSVIRPGQSLADVGDDENLVQAGLMDSLAVIQIILFLEQEFGLDLQAAGIDPLDLVTIDGLLAATAQRT